MKYIFTLITLFTLTFSYSQAYQTYTMHFVQVEGDLNAFEEREKLMQKVAQDAVDRGDISFWAFLKRYTGTGYGTKVVLENINRNNSIKGYGSLFS